MTMTIALTSSNAMAQEEIDLGAISDFFSEMGASIKDGVSNVADSAEKNTAEISNIDFSLDNVKTAIFGEPEVVEKVVVKPVEKVVEKVVYKDRIVEKIIKAQPKERSCVTKVHQLAVPAGESTTITTCTEWK